LDCSAIKEEEGEEDSSIWKTKKNMDKRMRIVSNIREMGTFHV